MTDRLRNEVTEAILRRAVIDAHELDMAEIPPNEELAKMHKFSEAHEARMRALFRREERREFFSKSYVFSRRAAVVILILVTALFGLLLTDSNIQAVIRETLITHYERFTMFRFQDTGHVVGETSWFPGFIPEGFEITNEVEFYIGRLFYFENADGNRLTFEYSPAAGAFIGIDNEYTEMLTITRNGIEYFVVTPLPGSEHSSQVIWQTEGYVIMLLSCLDSDTLFEIALSVARVG
ncbi:MAG: DUF4367 domain-containing protein [Defluviitaleaceae bacterium]|nr:DUF4367 domain-containing protein [Defluviitaleaceae bacterium]